MSFTYAFFIEYNQISSKVVYHPTRTHTHIFANISHYVMHCTNTNIKCMKFFPRESYCVA